MKRIICLFFLISTSVYGISLYEYGLWRREFSEAAPQDRVSYILNLVAYVEHTAHNNDYASMLYAYNALRELFNLKVDLNSAINRNWVIEQGYRAVKAQINEDFNRQIKQIKPVRRLCAMRVLQAAHEASKKARGVLGQKFYELYKRFSYRYFCEIDGKKALLSLTQLNDVWIRAALKTSVKLVLAAAHPVLTGPALNLAQSVQKKCGIKDEILYFKGQTSVAGMYDGIKYMIVEADNRIEDCLFGLYHEMGHFLHGDILNQQNYKSLAMQAAFKGDIARIVRYLNKGKSILPVNTVLGKYLKSALSNHSALWIKPRNPERIAHHSYIRGKEQRADLYALDMLFREGKIKAIVHAAYHFGMTDYIVAQGEKDDHPSHVERSLYILGFLADKNINIAAQLREYERVNYFAR